MIEALRQSFDADEEAWFRCARGMVAAGREVLLPLIGTQKGREVLGRGGGGDETMELDRTAEDAMLAVLARLAPHPHRVVSEEAGVSGESKKWHVVIDPVDGSLNAKRGLEPFSAVVAVADGPTLGDVCLGYIEDYTRGEAYVGVRGRGIATSRRLEPAITGGEVELILLEAGRPDRHHFDFSRIGDLAPTPRKTGVRVRQLGSLALAICQVAIGVADVVVTPIPSRAVDVAAALLMVREAGGGARGLDGSELESQPLDLSRRAPFVAWRKGVDGETVLARAQRLFR